MKIVKRLTDKEEKKLFSDKVNKENLTMFRDKILPFFFYDKASHNKIVNRVNNILTDGRKTYIDKLLKLNNQKRAFYETDLIPTLDKSFLYYEDLLQNKMYSLYYYWARDKFKNTSYGMLQQQLFNYDNFLTNKITIEKQEMKLFKFLLNSKYFTKEEIKKITTFKTKKQKGYLCISTNPIDYIFSSTNQSFGSCVSFDRNGPLYCLGIAGLSIDPNRFIMFVTNGDHKSYKMKGCNLTHLSYASRWWNILGKKDIVLTLPSYPGKEGFYTRKSLLEQIKLKCTENDYPSNFDSKFEFYPVRFKDKKYISTISLDSIGLATIKKNKVHYTVAYQKDKIHSHSGDIYTGLKFEQLKEYKDIFGEHECVECKRRMSYHKLTPKKEKVCETCYNKLYFRCYQCGKTTDRKERYPGGYCKKCHDKREKNRKQNANNNVGYYFRYHIR